jgi:small-conductance mechanosensitive channel
MSSKRMGPETAALLEEWLKSLLGSSATAPAIGPLSWAGVGAVLIFAALGLVAQSIAAAILRALARPRADLDADPTVRPHVGRAVGKPAYSLIWIATAYFMAAPLVVALGPSAAAATLERMLGDLLDLGSFAVLFWVCHRFTSVLDERLERWGARGDRLARYLLLPLIGRSLRILLPILGVIFALPLLDLPDRYGRLVSKGTSILLIIALALIAFQAVRTLERALLLRFDIHAPDNLQARKVHTQVQVIGRAIDVVICLLALASILMLFSEVRHVGTSLLASAGIVSIVAGVAAQKPLANVLAGFQIALAQPVRVDDVVIVEGEWGRIEEITLTYVVVHVWDDRRLVLPLSYFIEKPFQNWTRTSSELLGSVFVWVDYTFPVEEGRAALKEIIDASPRWDKRFWNLQVTDADARTMQLRVLATAANASQAFDLRCEIREKFIAHIQKHHPQSLPRVRANLNPS